jgi:hypothetical protein
MVIVKTSVYTVQKVFRLADDSAPTLDIAEDLVCSLLKIHYNLHDFSVDYAGGWKWDILGEHGHIGIATVKHIEGVVVAPSIVRAD